MSIFTIHYSKIKRFLYKPAIILLLLFAISVILRIHAFNDPLRGKHAWLTAHVALTTKIWNEHGIAKFNFSPVYTYQNNNDKHMRTLASGLKDKEGNYYYVSYPPFCFIFAFLFFKIFFITPGIEGLQVINLFIHGCTSYLIYVLTCHIYKKEASKVVFTPALVSSTFYLFSHQTLWCHINMYFSDTLILLFWVLYLLVVFDIFQRKGISNWLLIAILFVTNFLSIYTEWLGLFTAFLVFIISIYRGAKDRRFLIIAILITVSTLLALLLTAYQYSSLNNLNVLRESLLSKYLQRSGYSYNNFYLTKVDALILLKHYQRMQLPNLMAIIFLALITIAVPLNISIKRIKDHLFIIGLLVLPILVHHLIFLEFSKMHDFSTLKSSILFSLLIGFLYNLWISSSNVSFGVTRKFSTLTTLAPSAVLVCLLVLNIVIYYSYSDFSPNSIFNETSKSINLTASSEVALYAISETDRDNGIIVFMGADRAFSPQIQFLTHRNILAMSDRKAVLNHMKLHKRENSLIYVFDTYGDLIGIESITF